MLHDPKYHNPLGQTTRKDPSSCHETQQILPGSSFRSIPYLPSHQYALGPVFSGTSRQQTCPHQRLTPQSSEKKTAHSSCSSTPTTNPNPAAAVIHQTQDQSRTTHGHHHQTRPHTYTGFRSSAPDTYSH